MELAFLSPSPMELMVIAVIALIVLGPSRLPDAARSVGKGMREMRDSFQGLRDDDDDDRTTTIDEDDEDDDDEDASTPTAPPAAASRYQNAARSSVPSASSSSTACV